MPSVSKTASGSSDEDAELRRGPWTVEEDRLLIHHIACHGEGRWNLLAKRSGLRRTGKSCRLRWLNYLKPDVKRGNLTPQEQLLILELHSKWGNRWSRIAQHLPGRTDNEIKNYWRTRVQKQARHLKIDSNSTAFQELIRCFWMPRLLQKIQGSSSSQPFNHDASKSQRVSQQEPTDTSERIIQGLDHYNLMNSTSENCCTSSSMSSSESMNISQIPQVSEHPQNPFHAMPSTEYSPIFKGPYSVDNISHGMETLSLPAMPATTCDFKDPMGGFFSEENNWVDDFLVDNWWSMEELLQFRQLQEKGS